MTRSIKRIYESPRAVLNAVTINAMDQKTGMLKNRKYAGAGSAARHPNRPVSTSGAKAMPVSAKPSFIEYLRTPNSLDKVCKIDVTIYQVMSKSRILEEQLYRSCNAL